MKQAAKNILTLISKDEQSVMSVEIITMAPCAILQLLNAKLGVTVKFSYKPEISRFKGWLRNTGSYRDATRLVMD